MAQMTSCDLHNDTINRLKAELAAAKADAYNTMRGDLFNYLDGLIITHDNIGDIRRSLLLPFDCEWNSIVRDQTAAREGMIHHGK